MDHIAVIKSFDTLLPAELYAILRLRNEVFVVEQSCIYQDADNKDPKCHHLMLFNNNELAAYARLVPPGISFDERSIGRVVTNPKWRGTGVGRMLMNLAIVHCLQLYDGHGPIKIGAQAHLVPFYESLGFVPLGEIYDEDGIPHIDMIKK